MKKRRSLFQRLFCQGLLGEIREKSNLLEESRTDYENMTVRCLKAERIMRQESEAKQDAELKVKTLESQVSKLKDKRDALYDERAELMTTVAKGEKRISQLEGEIKARKELHKNDLAKAKEDAQAPTKALDDMWKFIESKNLQEEFQKSLIKEEDETTSN